MIALVAQLADKYGISSIQPLLETCRSMNAEEDLRVAVFGRFKAGKSSFLNDLFGRPLLPVGVIPVTTVITDIGYGPRERARIEFVNGGAEEVPVEEIGRFISEAENPQNRKQVASVTVDLPSLIRFRGIRFVDTPGLESVLAHNTRSSLAWLPKVELAVVTVAVDPPLSQRDIELIRELYDYTPHVTVLLTKVDVLSDAELAEVLGFVRDQLGKNLDQPPGVFPYSIRPGYEPLRRRFEAEVIRRTLAGASEHKAEIARRKTATLARECEDYLRLALKSAETIDSERESLKRLVVGKKQALDDMKLQLGLIARYAAGGTRDAVTRRLETHQSALERQLLDEFREEFPGWTRSLPVLISSFQEWLSRSLGDKLAQISAAERKGFVAPVEKVRKQLARLLQDFRARLSERTTRAFGVPLRSTEITIVSEEPRAPDIRIGRAFDHQWELLGPLVPMRLVRPLLKRHFTRKEIPYEVFKNLSRLASQWEESVDASLAALAKEAEARSDELIRTIERLLSRTSLEAPQIRADLAALEAARAKWHAEPEVEAVFEGEAPPC